MVRQPDVRWSFNIRSSKSSLVLLPVWYWLQLGVWRCFCLPELVLLLLVVDDSGSLWLRFWVAVLHLCASILHKLQSSISSILAGSRLSSDYPWRQYLPQTPLLLHYWCTLSLNPGGIGLEVREALLSAWPLHKSVTQAENTQHFCGLNGVSVFQLSFVKLLNPSHYPHLHNAWSNCSVI